MSLPNEIFIQILEHLDFRSLLVCMQVSPNFRDLIGGTASLQYIIELAVSGQQDGCRDPMTTSEERLNRLRKHRSAWKNLKWSREVEFPMGDGGLWELFGGVLAHNNQKGELIFHQLPSDIRGIEEKTWTLGPDFGCIIGDFAMDQYQDLLVLVEAPQLNANGGRKQYRVHLLSLTTGRAHPLAKDVILSLPQRGNEIATQVSFTIQIFGELIAVLTSPDFLIENQVGVWEWKTGRMLLNIFGEEVDSFSLLSYRYIAFAVIDQFGNPIFLVVDLTKESSDCRSVYANNSGRLFRYPPPAEEAFVHTLQLRADPGPLCGENRKVPFFQEAKNFLLVLNMWISVDDIERHVMHFIPSQYLISLMESGTEDALVSWISQGTRMYVTSQREASDVWVCYVYGTRFVTGVQALHGKDELPVQLYDFNKLALRRDAQTSAESEGPGSVQHLANHTHWRDPFCDEIETTLPYWENVACLQGGKDYDQQCEVMCSEDNIVIVDVRVLHDRNNIATDFE